MQESTNQPRLHISYYAEQVPTQLQQTKPQDQTSQMTQSLTCTDGMDSA